MDVKNLQQGTAEWLEWRKGGIGASDVAALANGTKIKVPYTDLSDDGEAVEGRANVNGTPFKTCYQLWREKTGRDQPPDLSNNPHVKRGNALEEPARAEASEYFGTMLVPACAQHEDYPFVRVSFDAVFPNGNTLEIKAPGDKVYAKAKEEGPISYYVWQVIDQMAVSEDAEYGYLYLYRENEKSLIYRFARVDVQPMIDQIIELQQTFWNQVVFDNAPELDPKRDVLDMTDNARFRSASEAWRNAKTKETQLKKSLDEAKAKRQEAEKELVEAAGDHACASNALVKMTRFTKQGNVDYAKLVADHMGELTDGIIAPYRRASSEQVKVSAVR